MPLRYLTAGESHTCALLGSGDVSCWGSGSYGRLGYGNTNNIGDNEAPWIPGPVDLGASATHVTAGLYHTCASTTGGAIRCWGGGSFGKLGYANTNDIGDDEAPSTAGDVVVE